MAQSSKTFAGSTLTPSGSAAVVGNDLRIAAVKSYDSDFSQYADGTEVPGWTEVTATFVKQTNAGTPVGRLAATTGGWCGTWRAAGVGDGTWKVKAKTIGGRVNSAAQWNHTSGAGIGYQFPGTGIAPAAYIPANFAGIYINGGTPATLVATDEVSNTVLAHPVSALKKLQVIRSTSAPKAYESEFPASWCAGTDFCLQGYIGTADIEYIRYWGTLTGGFTATLTPLAVTSLTRIAIEWDCSASSKKTLSELFQYQIDGGSWVAVPNDGYINAACTATIGIRATALKNDYDASSDLNVYSVSVEIAGQWDAYVPATVNAPTALSAGNPTASSIDLTWTDAASPAAFYDVYMATSLAGTYSLVEVASQGDQAVSVYGLAGDTAYWFKLKARSTEGATSAFTSAVTASTSVSLTPDPPTALVATPGTKGKARLSFTDPTSAVYHRVYKSLTNDPNTASLVGIVNQGVQLYDLTGLPNNTTVYLWLKAVNASDLVSVFSTGTSVLTLPAHRVRDEEVYEDEYIDILRTNLATKFADITTEKNDSITLPTIDDADWVKDLSGAYNNRGAFIVCAIEDSIPVESQKGGGGTSRDIIMKAFLFAPKTNDPDARAKVLRTSRAFRELIEENWRKVGSAGPPKLDTLTPETVQLQSDGSTYWAGGVRFTFTIT